MITKTPIHPQQEMLEASYLSVCHRRFALDPEPHSAFGGLDSATDRSDVANPTRIQRLAAIRFTLEQLQAMTLAATEDHGVDLSNVSACLINASLILSECENDAQRAQGALDSEPDYAGIWEDRA